MTTQAALTARLEACHSSVIHDVMRDLRLPIRVLPRNMRGIEPTMRCAGPVTTVRGRPDPKLTKDESLYAWAGLLSKAKPGHVIICQPQDDIRALMGELSAEALKIKGVRGYIVDGGCRDAQGVVDQGFPVFCRYFTPIDIVGSWKAEAFDEEIAIGGHDIRPTDHVIADRDGIILIPGERIEDVLAAAEAKLSGESAMMNAIRAGEDPQQAYLKHRVF
ncbi:MAG: RraA family protein [Bosea sp. (in: a-proteobacteria)]